MNEFPWQIAFYRGSIESAVERLRDNGGLLVAPSGPGLAELTVDKGYARALEDADIVLADSGFMVLFWWLLTGQWIARHSGYRFLYFLVNLPGVDWENDSLWVMPNAKEARAMQQRFASQGIHLPESAIYLAPHYKQGAIEDPELVNLLKRLPVHWLMIQIGGGVQEPLGAWLKQELATFSPAILCTGAASAFILGHQVRIPLWADRLFLGWLFRSISRPSVYGLRYWKSFSLLFCLYRVARKSALA
jgi:UDP-N-acetyl-D-mannosaminuronic acid transferase (WecB/TagA/CpsF family)